MERDGKRVAENKDIKSLSVVFKRESLASQDTDDSMLAVDAK